MTPGARLQAAIEVLDLIRDSRAPADGVLKAWGREHRFAGSGDRRAIAERVYSTLRARVRLTHLMDGEDGRSLVLGALRHLDGLETAEIEALFTGGHHPAPVGEAERGLLDRPPPPAPDWVEAGAPEFIVEAFKAQFGDAWQDEAQALILPRAPVDLTGKADLVFVDAPCSGSGTWRRHPEGAWRLVPASVTRLAALQLEILTRAAKLVRPGGRLAYATCSVLDEENHTVADAFLAAHPEFAPLPIADAARTPNLTDAARTRLAQIAEGHRLLLTPHRTHTDGFFLALFTRRPAAS